MLLPIPNLLLLLASLAAITDGKRIPINTTTYTPTVTLYVGTPPQKVTVEFDAGSPLFWTRGVDPDGQCAVQYNSNASSTSELGSGDVFFWYGSGGITGPSSTDLAGFDSPPSMRTDVTSTAKQTGPTFTSCYDGILGMDEASQFMTSYFKKYDTIDAEKYYVTDFNIIEDDFESWFEIGDPEDGTGSYFNNPSECVALLPRSFEDRMVVASINGQPQANETFWWQFNVTQFTIGDNKNTGLANAFVDDGTQGLYSNFAPIFSPKKVPENICQYMYENNATLDVEYISKNDGKAGVYSLDWRDLLFGTNQNDNQICLIYHAPDFPKTLMILGSNFYNKYLIKHDYAGDGQVCATTKPNGYKPFWQSSSMPDFPKKKSKKSKK